jgi:hypothetical protein
LSVSAVSDRPGWLRLGQAAAVRPSEDSSGRGSALPAAGRRGRPGVAAWWLATVIVGVLSGYVLVAPEWTSPAVPFWTLGGACLGLALAVVISHLKVHSWWGIVLVWVAFMVGMVPPLSNDDALWAAGALFFGAIAGGYLVVANLVIAAARTHLRRRS